MSVFFWLEYTCAFDARRYLHRFQRGPKNHFRMSFCAMQSIGTFVDNSARIKKRRASLFCCLTSNQGTTLFTDHTRCFVWRIFTHKQSVALACDMQQKALTMRAPYRILRIGSSTSSEQNSRKNLASMRKAKTEQRLCRHDCLYQFVPPSSRS